MAPKGGSTKMPLAAVTVSAFGWAAEGDAAAVAAVSTAAESVDRLEFETCVLSLEIALRLVLNSGDCTLEGGSVASKGVHDCSIHLGVVAVQPTNEIATNTAIKAV